MDNNAYHNNPGRVENFLEIAVSDVAVCSVGCFGSVVETPDPAPAAIPG